MPKLALHFICKNESHVVKRMLNSVKGITDLIVANDTGSIDGTQDIIKQFGADNFIPTYVFERPFDDFGSSRQYALDQLRKVVQELHWNAENVWAFWIDCDALLIINEGFVKEVLTKDVYNVVQWWDKARSFQHNFFKLSKDVYWDGPVHEILTWNDPAISNGHIDNLYIVNEKIGHSWRGDLVVKYRKYAELLENFMASQARRDPLFIYNTIRCYIAALNHCKDESIKARLLIKVLQYCEEIISVERCDLEIRFYGQWKKGEAMSKLGQPWLGVEWELLKAFQIDPLRAEPFPTIIMHYMDVRDWEKAYYFSKVAKDSFHGKNPFGKRWFEVNDPLYNWQLLFNYYMACFYSGRKVEAAETCGQLYILMDEHPEYFSNDDIAYIRKQLSRTPAKENGKSSLKDFSGRIIKTLMRKS